MRWAEVNWEICQGCKKCLASQVCTTRAITRLDTEQVMYVEPGRCIACGKCAAACAFRAIRVYDPLTQACFKGRIE